MNAIRLRLLQSLRWLFFLVAAADGVWAGMATVLLTLQTSTHPSNPFALEPQVWLIEGLILVVLWTVAAFNWFAARRAEHLRGYRWLVFVAVLDLLPLLHCFYVAGLPIGILALIALANRPVREVFRAVEAGETREQALARLAPPPPKFTAADEMDTANDDWDEGGKPR